MDKIQHFEIPADDLERADEFYSKTFGWKIQDASIEGMEYHMAYTTDVDDKFMPKDVGAINGGLYKRAGNEGPIIVITVPSIEVALNKVKEAGGTVEMEPRKTGDMGIYAKIKDTEGNIIGVWEALNSNQ